MSHVKPKRVCESQTEQVQIILPQHINGYNRLFGGQLVAWMDIVAGVVARRHTQGNVTTVFIDSLQFKAPAYVDNIIVLTGKVTYVGNTSMEVRVDAYVENIDGEKKLVNSAYFVMVALDYNENPTKVPGLILETEEEKEEWEAGLKRYNLRLERRQQKY
jgi:acyl-CoA hydrolase